MYMSAGVTAAAVVWGILGSRLLERNERTVWLCELAANATAAPHGAIKVLGKPFVCVRMWHLAVVPEHIHADDSPAERRVGALNKVVVDVLLVVHRIQTLRTSTAPVSCRLSTMRIC